ncbi:hypothetical protein BFV94_4325 [Alteromonas macleodii]|uniref:Uncharacterized protein n=2 Tax=Alteromonas macleodii TaxID=28108 RepID=A0AB36FNE7_ALTMA|nr:hypothetical protein BFV95_4879 [Alteromonas macleodii]OES25718.1 hypothetical protein BFV94_4325 [Alteromonas macleodii]OES38604.1 hypothetical protein BFV96_4715 [Alteromonas macleodii]
MNHSYEALALTNQAHQKPWSVVRHNDNGGTEIICGCDEQSTAFERAKRFNAIRDYMQLDGEQRMALMIMLDVEKQPPSKAYSVCIDYIVEQRVANGEEAGRMVA